MQIGIMSRTFFRPTLEEELDAVVDHGITCMQFDLSSAGIASLPDQIDEDLCSKIHDAFKARNLTMAGVNGLFNMIHPDTQHRENGLKNLGVVASACEKLGTSIIALCTGTRNEKMMWLPHPDNNTPAAWKDLLACMEKAVEIAEKHKVTLAFEPEVANVVDSAQKARQLIDEISSPNLKVIIDGANVFHAGELPRMAEILDEAFSLLSGDIAFAHAKDLDHDGAAGHLPAGKGVLDYTRYLSLINDLDPAMPVLLHGLKEQDVDDCVAFLRSKQT